MTSVNFPIQSTPLGISYLMSIIVNTTLTSDAVVHEIWRVNNEWWNLLQRCQNVVPHSTQRNPISQNGTTKHQPVENRVSVRSLWHLDDALIAWLIVHQFQNLNTTGQYEISHQTADKCPEHIHHLNFSTQQSNLSPTKNSTKLIYEPRFYEL